MIDRPGRASAMQRGLFLLTGSRRRQAHWTVGAGVAGAGLACCAAIFLAVTSYPMERFFFIASVVSTFLKFAGTAIAVTAVGVFGFYFIRDNGRSARRGQNSVPAKAWRGAGPRKAARILAVGAFALTLSVLVSLILPATP